MTRPTEAQIRDALSKVRDPDSGKDIISSEMASGLVLRDGNVGFAIEADPRRAPHLQPLRKEAEQAPANMPDLLSVTAVLTAQSPRPARAPAAGGAASAAY